MGVDQYTRLDAAAAWLADTLGQTPPDEPGDCAGIGATGRCLDGRAVYCDGQQLRSEPCGDAGACGWSPQQDGYRCVEPAEAGCEGIDQLGACEGDLALRCADGELLQTDCTSCEQRCGRSAASGTYRCLSP
jgi:hypothetical protein